VTARADPGGDRRTVEREALARAPGRRAAIALWLGVLVPPVAALAMQTLDYAIVPWACARTDHIVARVWLRLLPAVVLICVIELGALAWKQRARSTPAAQGSPAESRPHFMALVAVGLTAFSVLVIVAQWLATLFFGPCVHA